MLGTLHARIWRWRALGLSHPQRSDSRSQESIAGLRGMLAAIRQRDANMVMCLPSVRRRNHAEAARHTEVNQQGARTLNPKQQVL